MKTFHFSLLLSVSLIFPSLISAQPASWVSAADLKVAEGNWSGTLTYLDYTSGKPFTMTADLEIRRIGKTNDFEVFYRYPKEPQANSNDTLRIAADSSRIDGDRVVSRKTEPDGTLVIVTESAGKDGNDGKAATFKRTYRISAVQFSITKDVRFEGTTEWIRRHEYAFSRLQGK